MRTLLMKFFMAIGVVWFIGLLVLGFLAYFVTSAGPHDGLGRALTQAPIVMRVLVGQDRMWAGWGWFAVDMVVFWGSIAAAAGIAKLFDKDGHA